MMADQSIQYKNMSRLSNGTNGSFVMETPSFKRQRKDYRKQKKKVVSEIFSTIEDINDIKSGWLKVRVSLKRWTKLWFILKPGFLLAFNSEDLSKKNQIGIVSLKICQIIERPTKKEGFCFKLFSPIGKNIWLKNSALNLVLSQASLILRASDTDSGLDWMNAIRKSNISADLNSSQLFRSNYEPSETSGLTSNNNNNIMGLDDVTGLDDSSDDEYENTGQVEFTTSSVNSEDSRLQGFERNTNGFSANSSVIPSRQLTELQTNYITDGQEELGTVGKQTEVVGESNAKFLWHILKQVRPGMDLSKVTLPTFILEPRSFLEKLADYYYHNDILSEAVAIDDPLYRLINIVKWYLSGFYKKPMGLKKPYNPILGEKFRCYWEQPKTSSKTFYIAEQVSHHPPISAFHVTNRKDGFCLTSALLAKSKFFGNSVSALLDGKAKLYLMKRDETYTLTMPHAHCGGIILGSLCLELGGKVEISCPDTACRCELEFKLANMLSSADYYNSITGKIYQGSKTTHTLDGHWDKKIYIVNKATEERSILWEVTDKTRSSRLRRFVVPTQQQNDRESVRLWSKVSEAVKAGDHVTATKEKSLLEDAQRKVAKEHADNNTSWDPDLFKYDTFTNEWSYKYLDNRKWDEAVDIHQFEKNFMVKTLSQSRSNVYDPTFDVLVNQINRYKSRLSDIASNKPDNNNICSLMDNQETSPKSDNNVNSLADSQLLFHGNRPSSKDESLRDIKQEVKNLKDQLQSLLAHQGVLKKEQSSPKSILNTRYLLLITVLVLSIVIYQMFGPFYTLS